MFIEEGGASRISLTLPLDGPDPKDTQELVLRKDRACFEEGQGFMNVLNKVA